MGRQKPGYAFRGSAQALLVDRPELTVNFPKRHYLAFLHIVDTATKQYAHFAYRFAPDPPFGILQVSRQVELQELRPENGGEAFAFLSGLAIFNDSVVISYAAGDRDPRALVLTLE